MNHTQKITRLSVIAGMLLIAPLATTANRTETALAQNMSNQTVETKSLAFGKGILQVSYGMNRTREAMAFVPLIPLPKSRL